VTPVLLVELNRGELHQIEAPSEFATSEAFSLELRNHGESVHVHVHRDDDLSAVTTVDADGNLYVEGETTRSVPVEVSAADSPVTGTLEIATGYGSERASVRVTVETRETGPDVEVDDTLSQPSGSDSSSDSESALLSDLIAALPGRRIVPVFAVGVVATALAVWVAGTIDSPVVFIGAGVVVGAVIAALVSLFAE
jgi:hypothetical protein